MKKVIHQILIKCRYKRLVPNWSAKYLQLCDQNMQISYYKYITKIYHDVGKSY